MLRTRRNFDKPDQQIIEIFSIPSGQKKTMLLSELASFKGADSINIDLRFDDPHEQDLFLKDLFEALKKNASITRINYLSRVTSTELFTSISRGIGENPHLKDVELCCRIYPELLLPALSQTRSIEQLKLACCGIYDHGAKILAKGIVSNTTLKILDLTNSGLAGEGCVEIVRAVTQQKKIYDLSLRTNAIDSSSMAQIVALLSPNETLKHLDLNYVNLNNSCAELLSDLIRSNRGLKNIELSNCDMNIDPIISALENDNATSRLVSLGWNKQGDKRMQRDLQKVYPAAAKNEKSPLVFLSMWVDELDTTAKVTEAAAETKDEPRSAALP